VNWVPVVVECILTLLLGNRPRPPARSRPRLFFTGFDEVEDELVSPQSSTVSKRTRGCPRFSQHVNLHGAMVGKIAENCWKNVMDFTNPFDNQLGLAFAI
jgi:hypothetical protein